jgi:hypothetical protein
MLWLSRQRVLRVPWRRLFITTSSTLKNASKKRFESFTQRPVVLFNTTTEQMRGYWLNEYFPRAMATSIEQFEGLHKIQRLEASGFDVMCVEPYAVQEDLKDNFAYSGKHQP